MISFYNFVVLVLFCLLGCFCSASARSTTPAQRIVAQPNEPKNAIQVFVSTIRNARHHLAAAAVARSVSIFSMYPVDTIKVSTMPLQGGYDGRCRV